MHADKITEIRRFCLEMMDVLDYYYDYVNAYNNSEYVKHLEKRRKRAEGVFGIIGYVLSCIPKATMVALGKGHFVDFESFSAYKERMSTKVDANFWVEYSMYVMNLGKQMTVAINNTREMLRTNEDGLIAFYQNLMKKRHHQDVTKPLIWAILECDAELPFSKPDWERYFRITEDVVTRDVPGCNYVTRFRNVYREHDERMVKK